MSLWLSGPAGWGSASHSHSLKLFGWNLFLQQTSFYFVGLLLPALVHPSKRGRIQKRWAQWIDSPRIAVANAPCLFRPMGRGEAKPLKNKAEKLGYALNWMQWRQLSVGSLLGNLPSSFPQGPKVQKMDAAQDVRLVSLRATAAKQFVEPRTWEQAIKNHVLSNVRSLGWNRIPTQEIIMGHVKAPQSSAKTLLDILIREQKHFLEALINNFLGSRLGKAKAEKLPIALFYRRRACIIGADAPKDTSGKPPELLEKPLIFPTLKPLGSSHEPRRKIALRAEWFSIFLLLDAMLPSTLSLTKTGQVGLPPNPSTPAEAGFRWSRNLSRATHRNPKRHHPLSRMLIGSLIQFRRHHFQEQSCRYGDQ